MRVAALAEALAEGLGQPAPSIARVSTPSMPKLIGRVLVAEDNSVNQRVALAMLARLGLTAHAVGNGREAVEAARDLPFDLILMDCQMPEMDGYAATAAIRASEAGGPRVPIIALTADAIDGARERCLRSGMDAYLTKPIRQEELITALQVWLRVGTDRVAADKRVPSPAAGLPSMPKPCDEAVILRLVHELGDEAALVLPEISAALTTDVMLLITSTATALAAGDHAALARDAHRLKGQSLTLGLGELVNLAKAIERATKGHEPSLPALVAGLGPAWERARLTLAAAVEAALSAEAPSNSPPGR